MKKVITYGTFDLFHEGHLKLLERAKELGDYLIVGVTSDDYDMYRGKINGKMSLIERIKYIENTGLADQVIVEEYEGQKIDDIIKYDVDIFVVGSDWKGKFDYLKNYCEVIYLDRTEGISSTQIREEQSIKLGIVGDNDYLNKFYNECKYVNGLSIEGVCTQNIEIMNEDIKNLKCVTSEYDELLEHVDAVYIKSHPSKHYKHIKKAIDNKKHVLCESPISLKESEAIELFSLARKNSCVLMEALKTAYTTAYARLIPQAMSGEIGDIVSIKSTCTSIRDIHQIEQWSSLTEWGPTSFLPVLQIFGNEYNHMISTIKKNKEKKDFDIFSLIQLIYSNGVGICEVGCGTKSEGELIISGTKGYIYVPAPWWKTDYYEIRYENPANNKRFFYQQVGEGIRYELVAFYKQIFSSKQNHFISEDTSIAIVRLIESINKNSIELS